MYAKMLCTNHKPLENNSILISLCIKRVTQNALSGRETRRQAITLGALTMNWTCDVTKRWRHSALWLRFSMSTSTQRERDSLGALVPLTVDPCVMLAICFSRLSTGYHRNVVVNWYVGTSICWSVGILEKLLLSLLHAEEHYRYASREDWIFAFIFFD